MNISLIGVPIYYGCDNPGVETAPDVIRRMGLVAELEDRGGRVIDNGDIQVQQVGELDKFAADERMKFSDQVFDACERLSDEVAGQITEGRFPLIIGGDHSCGAGIISGVCRAKGSNSAVLWIDSHSDIHSFRTSPSGNIHGTPLGAAVGLECGRFTDLYKSCGHVNGENIFILGLRSFEPVEAEHIRENSVNTYSVEQLRERGVADVFREIGQKLKLNGVESLHLSIDIDGLDPSIAPGTGIHIPDGFTEGELNEMIAAAFSTNRVCSMDVMELNPLKDNDDMTSKLVIRTLAKLPELLGGSSK